MNKSAKFCYHFHLERKSKARAILELLKSPSDEEQVFISKQKENTTQLIKDVLFIKSELEKKGEK